MLGEGDIAAHFDGISACLFGFGGCSNSRIKIAANSAKFAFLFVEFLLGDDRNAQPDSLPLEAPLRDAIAQLITILDVSRVSVQASIGAKKGTVPSQGLPDGTGQTACQVVSTEWRSPVGPTRCGCPRDR